LGQHGYIRQRQVNGARHRLHGAISWSPLVLATVLSTLGVTFTQPALPAVAASPPMETLPGALAPVPPGATYIGPAPASVALPLEVALEPRDPAALSAAVQAVSDPGSPAYRHFLTPGQFTQLYGPTPAAIAQVTSALRSKGLSVGTISATGLTLPINASVAQAESAFSTPIAAYRLSSGQTGYDNTAAPSVPASVAAQIQGILGLDTLSPPVPVGGVTAPAQSPGRASTTQSAALASGQPAPTAGSCANNINNVKSQTRALDAVDLAQAYSFDPAYTNGNYGSGATVALVELSGAGYSSFDISTFANCYGISLGANQITETIIAGGGATGGNTTEAELDIETVLSLAPKAYIAVYEGGPTSSLYDVVNRIVSDDTAKIVSASWTNGCEAYVGQAYQNSENTLFQTAAMDGQSVFVASGDQGSEGCNVNGVFSAPTGAGPDAQAIDPSTGTLYVANQAANTVSVESEGSPANPSGFSTVSTVATGSTPDAVTLNPSRNELLVANQGSSSLTAVPTGTCNQSITSGCSSPTTVTASGGHLSGPTALAVNGSTLYIANLSGTVAVFAAATDSYVTSVNTLASTAPTALAVDPNTGIVYVSDGTNNRVEYFAGSSCNATTTSGCATAPGAVTVGNDPVAMTVDSGAGDLYIANAGTGGGVSVVGLASQTVTTTISTGQPAVIGLDGIGRVQSISMAPNKSDVLVVLNGLAFPGDVMATIHPGTQAITATVDLNSGTDAMGQLVSDQTRGYAWVTDVTSTGDVLQNLNPGVSDPAGQPYITGVGGTSLTALGPPPTESVWNDQLYYAEGAGGGGISQSFVMPNYQQSLGRITGSSGTPCGNSGGDCREVPDVAADADPSTGYIIYDTVNGAGGWSAAGGTSGAAPLWAGVLADVASANPSSAGFGNLNPTLYSLAQVSPGTYFNDVTVGNNDYNATNGGQFRAMTGYDMATGLGTPITSALATGITSLTVSVTLSGSQTYGSSVPAFTQTNNGPSGISVTGSLSCTTVGSSTAIGPTLAAGSYTVLASSCSGATLSGTNSGDYTIAYLSAPNGFVVRPAPLSITASSGSMVYGTTPPSVTAAYSGFVNNESRSSLSGTLSCTPGATSSSPVGSYSSSCSGLSDPNYLITYPKGTTTVTAATVSVTVSGSQTYGSSVPAFTQTNNAPSGISVTGSLSCTTVGSSTAIGPTLAAGSYTVLASSCSGATLSGTNSGDYTIAYLSAPNGFVVRPGTNPSPPPPPPPPPPSHGYWLVGSDGGIFTFGSAQFYGSTGNIRLNRPVVGITPTADLGGYWLVATDGGIFSFGDTQFYGSVPGLGLAPAGSSGPGQRLNAPIVGMVPAIDDRGYFMVASDGGVFAFGDATFEGSCPGIIGGCSGPAVAVMPDASGHGYWLVTQTGHVYTFGDAPFLGAPGPVSSAVTSAVRSPDGRGYWILTAGGTVYAYGTALNFGGPASSVGGLNPASAIFTTSDGGGYWVASAIGSVFTYGDAPFDGSMAGTHLNGSIIAATGY